MSCSPELSFREMNLRVFQGESIPHVLFQPRIEPWFHWHKLFGGLPERYRDMELSECFDVLDSSMRYVHYYTGMPSPVVCEYAPQVEVIEALGETRGKRIYRTPFGDLVQGLQFTVDQTWRTVEFPVKTADDLRALRWLYEHTDYHFSPESFAAGDTYVGQRGVPQFWVPKSPYQALAQVWMKLPDLIYALVDAPEIVHDTMRAIDDSYDALYEDLAQSPVQIINFGENIHDQLISPRYWETYFVPFYEKRCGQLHAAGIYSHVHIDGFFRSLLPYLATSPFDGLEALTPTPQGDVTMEEMAEHIGDKVLLDGIPAVLFMPQYSREELMAAVEKLYRSFLGWYWASRTRCPRGRTRRPLTAWR